MNREASADPRGGTWDAVVIGAGHNGLVAATLLARRGWNVLVLEAQPTPGGAVRHGEVTSPGFVSDLFSAFYPLAAVSPALTSLDLGAHGLRWVQAPHVLTHLLPGGGSARLSTHVAHTAASVDRHHHGDGRAWTALHQRWSRVRAPVLGALLGSFPPVRHAGRLVRLAGPGESLRLGQLAATSSMDFVRHQFGGPGAQVLVAGNGLHADIPPTAPGSALLGLILSMVGQDTGFPVPRGGAGALTDALVAALRASGGHLRCSTVVERIEVNGLGDDYRRPHPIPSGSESVWAYTHLPRDRGWTPERVGAHVVTMEDLVEAHAPGFRSRILSRYIQRPEVLESSDANLLQGAINAGTTNLWQQLIFRPVPGLGRPETFIDGLYLAGATAHPGGGVHGAPGANAARAALRRRACATRPLSKAVQEPNARSASRHLRHQGAEP